MVKRVGLVVVVFTLITQALNSFAQGDVLECECVYPKRAYRVEASALSRDTCTIAEDLERKCEIHVGPISSDSKRTKTSSGESQESTSHSNTSSAQSRMLEQLSMDAHLAFDGVPVGLQVMAEMETGDESGKVENLLAVNLAAGLQSIAPGLPFDADVFLQEFANAFGTMELQLLGGFAGDSTYAIWLSGSDAELHVAPGCAALLVDDYLVHFHTLIPGVDDVSLCLEAMR